MGCRKHKATSKTAFSDGRNTYERLYKCNFKRKKENNKMAIKNHYCSLRVKEDTKKLAKELSAKAGIPMKDFIQISLENRRDDNMDIIKENRRKLEFDFKI